MDTIYYELMTYIPHTGVELEDFDSAEQAKSAYNGAVANPYVKECMLTWRYADTSFGGIEYHNSKRRR